MPSTTRSNIMLFGKNSDRERNEAQIVEQHAAHAFEANDVVACTYIEIPQVRHRNATVLCRPFWIWGAEMGANEHGVVIGNEGLHAYAPAQKDSALTGMDLVRLALERSASASEAVNVITALLQRHGQGGNCGYFKENYYNNGFAIADRREAFVLETIGRDWVLERCSGIRTLSNCYSVGHEACSISSGLTSAITQWGRSGELPNYAHAIADTAREHLGNGAGRRVRSTSVLSDKIGDLAIADILAVLRDHVGGAQGPNKRGDEMPDLSICMHAHGADRRGQTVGSFASELSHHSSVHWVTATASPCISIFKPIFVDIPIPSIGPTPSDQYNSHSLWWRHERLHRMALMRGFEQFRKSIEVERDHLEREFCRRVDAVLDHDAAGRTRVVQECWADAVRMEEGWLTRLRSLPRNNNQLSSEEWAIMNKAAQLELGN